MIISRIGTNGERRERRGESDVYPKIKLLLIITLSLALALIFFTTTIRGDQVSSLNYYSSGNVDPPVVNVIFAMTFISPLQLWSAMIIIPFILGIISIYYLAEDLFHDETISLFAALQYGTSILVITLFSYGYIKQLLAMSLIPIAILYFHRHFHDGKKTNLLISGIIFGIIGLTHEIAFVSLLVFYLVFIGFQSGIHNQIHFPTINKFIIVGLPALFLCGNFYFGEAGAIIHAGGESIIRNYSIFYAVNYVYLALPLTFALIGIMVLKTHRYLMLSLMLSSLILIVGWVGYADRFMLQLALPLALFSGYGFKHLIDNRDFNSLTYVLCAVSAFSLMLAYFEPVMTIGKESIFLLFPITMISHIFTGWLAVILKFLIGIPLTIAIWVMVVKLLYYKLYRQGK